MSAACYAAIRKTTIHVVQVDKIPAGVEFEALSTRVISASGVTRVRFGRGRLGC